MENTSVGLDELKAKFHSVWLKGTGWRYEVGEVLYQIKERCEQGEWGKFLKDYDLPRSTADDYIRNYKDRAGIAETRQNTEPNPEPVPDPEAEEREELIVEEMEKRSGTRPTHHATQIRPTLKGLRPDQTTRYWEEYKEDRSRVEAIWQQAFLTIIRAEQLYPPVGEQLEEEAVAL
jgi:hypothetical protein